MKEETFAHDVLLHNVTCSPKRGTWTVDLHIPTLKSKATIVGRLATTNPVRLLKTAVLSAMKVSWQLLKQHPQYRQRQITVLVKTSWELLQHHMKTPGFLPSGSAVDRFKLNLQLVPREAALSSLDLARVLVVPRTTPFVTPELERANESSTHFSPSIREQAVSVFWKSATTNPVRQTNSVPANDVDSQIDRWWAEAAQEDNHAAA